MAVQLLRPILKSGPSPLHLVDLGCGDCKLQKALGKYPIVYHGFDAHPQKPHVRIWDAASSLPDVRCDVFVALGLLEYLKDPRVLLSEISRRKVPLICSYVTSDAGKYKEQDLSRLGWRTHYSKSEFEAELSAAGLEPAERFDRTEDQYSVWRAVPK